MRCIRFKIRTLMIAVAALALALPAVPSAVAWLWPRASARRAVQCSPCPVSPEVEASILREVAAKSDIQDASDRLIRQAEELEEAARLRARATEILRTSRARPAVASARLLLREADVLVARSGTVSQSYRKDVPDLPSDESDPVLEPVVR